MQFDYFIGIDISKDTLDFALLQANKVLFMMPYDAPQILYHQLSWITG